MNVLKYCLQGVLIFCCYTSYGQIPDLTTPQAVIEKAMEAMGGKDLLQSAKTLYTDSKTVLDGHNVNYVIKEMEPNKGSFEIIYNQRVVYGSYFDGQKGYQVNNGEKSEEKADVYKDKQYKKHIFNELDYLDPTLWKLELTGQEAVNGEPCYKVKAVLISGTTDILYFSKNSGFMLKDEKVVSEEEKRYNTVLFSDYKPYGKLVYYSVMTVINDGAPQQLRLEKVLINEGVNKANFELP